MKQITFFLQKSLFFAVALFFLAGCSYKPDIYSAKFALDYEGTYVGTFPCNNCDGIREILKILPQQTYEKKRIHLGESINVYQSKGFFSWHPSGNIIWLDDGSSYFVSENHLFVLDRDDRFIDKEVYKLDKFGIAYILPQIEEVD